MKYKKMGIGYLGPAGTFTEQVAAYIAQEHSCDLIEYPGIPDVIYATHFGDIQWGVVPIENSVEGSVTVTLDMLVHDVDVYIVQEVIIPIQQCLLVQPGCHKEDITLILSHPQALAQCRGYLYENFHGISQQNTLSTSEATRLVSADKRTYAAIGSKKAADRFGLQVLDEDIQDHKGNSTRFIIISKQEEEPLGNCKTSIAFTVTDRPGSLLEALQIFADAHVNLTRIESRPMKTLLGQYLFLIDMEGSRWDQRIQDILETIRRKSMFYKFLGSYSTRTI